MSENTELSLADGIILVSYSYWLMQVLGALAEMRGTGAVLLFHAESEVEEAGADREAMGQIGQCLGET